MEKTDFRKAVKFTMNKGEIAKELFMNGCNCSQAVAGAFADEIGLDIEIIKQLTIGFGGGIGRMREVCGAVCGMTFVISAVYKEDKGKIYERVQAVSDEFKNENGSIICRELLGLTTSGPDLPKPEARTQQYYKKRPCPQIVYTAAEILENYLKNNPA